jgi:broad specificity phosphatase PhoE
MDPVVWFVRHGQSEANAGAPTERHGSPPLTGLGRRQAEAAAGMVPQAPDLVVTSSFVRTIQSVEPLLRRFPGTPSEVWPVQEFTYLAPERYRNTTTADRRPHVREYWERCDPDYRDGPGAETFREFTDRAACAVQRLGTMRGFIVVAAHGQFMRAVVWLHFNNFPEIDARAMARYRDFRTAAVLPNACIVKMGWPEGDGPWFSGVVRAHADSLDDEA